MILKQTKKFSYRKATIKAVEQYGLNLPKKMIESMGISPTEREILVEYDENQKEIKIRKK